MGKEKRKSTSVCLAAAFILTCYLAQTVNCLRLTKTERRAARKESDVTSKTSVQEGKIVLGEVFEKESHVPGGPRTVSSNASVEDETYQADFPGWTKPEIDDSYKDKWNRMGTSLHCFGDHMKFRSLGLGASQLAVEQGNKQLLPLSMVPTKCGYKMHGNSMAFVMMVPYNGCNMIQQGDSYMLPLRWQGNPVSLLCPKRAKKFHHLTPEMPSVPQDPQVPEVPQWPPVPKVPQDPQFPQRPQMPSVPQDPQVPKVPQDPQWPPVPKVPQDPQWPPVPKVPQDPQWPPLPKVPQDPQWPPLPKVPQDPQWPPLPKVPQDPQWPPLPKVPQDPQWPPLPKGPQGPQFPQWPLVPPFPSYPQVPQDPQVPQYPQMPLIPPYPQMPQDPQMPQYPQMPLIPPYLQMPKVPQDPQMPQYPQMPLIPPYPQMPQDPQVPQYPQMPLIPPYLQMPKVPQDPQMPLIPPYLQMPKVPQDPQMPQGTQVPQVPQDPLAQHQPNYYSHPLYSYLYSLLGEYGTNLPQFPKYPQQPIPTAIATTEPPTTSAPKGTDFPQVPFGPYFPWAFGPPFPDLPPLLPYPTEYPKNPMPEYPQYPKNPTTGSKVTSATPTPSVTPPAATQSPNVPPQFYPPQYLPFFPYNGKDFSHYFYPFQR